MLLHALRGWMNSVEQCHIWKSQLMLEIRMLVISRCHFMPLGITGVTNGHNMRKNATMTLYVNTKYASLDAL